MPTAALDLNFEYTEMVYDIETSQWNVQDIVDWVAARSIDGTELVSVGEPIPSYRLVNGSGFHPDGSRFPSLSLGSNRITAEYTHIVRTPWGAFWTFTPVGFTAMFEVI